MTAITLSTFRSRIRLLGDYSNSGVFTDAFLTDQVNEAIGEYSDLLDSVWEGYRDKTGTVATVASTATVALPADFLKARAVDILIDASRYVPLRQLQPGSAYGFDGTSGRPVGYLHVGANLELFPTPDAVYTIRLRYVPTATVLSADGDSVDIPNGWEGFVIHTALLRLDEREQRDVGERLAIIDRFRQRIIAAAGDRNASGPEYLVVPGSGWEWFP